MRLLIIGNSSDQVTAAGIIAKKKQARVVHVTSIEMALENLRSGTGADLIMIDVSENIKKLIDSLDSERIHIPVVAYGINTKSQEAVKAIKSGAKEFIPLPPDEELIAAVFEAISAESNKMLFNSPAMSKVTSLADKIANSDASILITGESGTGKEVMARYIHFKSQRKDKDLISVNCAAIPENLLESEMFGHEKGAFTGAISRRIGKFEEADKGTLFLDEISEMDLKLQAKLLRAIQEKVITRVGGTEPVKLNIRILATSNINLIQAVKDGKFREDLFFRLNVINIHLPPLRERPEDIELLAESFMRKYTKANGMQEKPFNQNILTKLKKYTWPGNIRELENTIHRSVLLSGDTIDESSIVTDSQTPNINSSPSPENNDVTASQQSLVGRTMDSVERELILSTLDHCLGNRTHAANILGISIRTLRNKLKEYGQSEGENDPKAVKI